MTGFTVLVKLTLEKTPIGRAERKYQNCQGGARPVGKKLVQPISRAGRNTEVRGPTDRRRKGYSHRSLTLRHPSDGVGRRERLTKRDVNFSHTTPDRASLMAAQASPISGMVLHKNSPASPPSMAQWMHQFSTEPRHNAKNQELA